jgi:hypothetical protein
MAPFADGVVIAGRSIAPLGGVTPSSAGDGRAGAAFVAIVSARGEVKHTVALPASSVGALAVSGERIAIVGDLDGPAQLGRRRLERPSPMHSSAFVALLDAETNVAWAAPLGELARFGVAAAFAPGGRVWLAGSYDTAAALAPLGIPRGRSPEEGDRGLWIASFDEQGRIARARAWPGEHLAGPSSLFARPEGEMLLVGSHNRGIAFDAKAQEDHAPIDVVRIDPRGNAKLLRSYVASVSFVAGAANADRLVVLAYALVRRTRPECTALPDVAWVTLRLPN